MPNSQNAAGCGGTSSKFGHADKTRKLDAQDPVRDGQRRINRADDGIRTRGLRFTKPLLYQLSYVGAVGRLHWPHHAASRGGERRAVAAGS
jgi:hypothetical protein